MSIVIYILCFDRIKYEKLKLKLKLGGGWVQSTTFLGSFSFHDYLVFIGLYASLYIGDEETYKTF